MIGAGINIPVFKTALGSFDTHNNQEATHRRLLQNLDVSISLTVKALKKIGVWEKKREIVLILSQNCFLSSNKKGPVLNCLEAT